MKKIVLCAMGVLAALVLAGYLGVANGPHAPASASNDIVAGKLVDMVILQQGIINKGMPYGEALALLKDCRMEKLSIEDDYSDTGSKLITELCDCPNKKFRMVTGKESASGPFVVRNLFE